MSEAVPFREAVRVWARIAALSFGGPAGQIAVMHRILVEEKRWIGETRFLHALNYCMLLPGPEAHQLAVYVGWLMHRVRGGIMAGTLFVLPGLISLGVLSALYAAYGQIGVVSALFFGLKAAVLAIVLEAVQRIGKRALKSRAMGLIAVAAFVAIFFFAVPFPLVIALAVATGFAGHKFAPDLFQGASGHAASGNTLEDGLIDRQFASGIPEHVRPSWKRLTLTLALGTLIWFGPMALLAALLGPQNVLVSIAAFNSKMAVVTFGGAYAVLAYMAQQAVSHYHWLKPGEMLVGLGLAETTPGPLISVVQFVGFLAAFRAPGGMSPLLAGTIGGVVAMWATFVPSFLWIFLGGPYVEALLGNKALKVALSAVTAAVVGVILNLAVWFALHVVFREVVQTGFGPVFIPVPVWASISWPALMISTGAIIATFGFKWLMLPLLAAASAAGIAWYLVAGAL